MDPHYRWTPGGWSFLGISVDVLGCEWFSLGLTLVLRVFYFFGHFGAVFCLLTGPLWWIWPWIFPCSVGCLHFPPLHMKRKPCVLYLLLCGFVSCFLVCPGVCVCCSWQLAFNWICFGPWWALEFAFPLFWSVLGVRVVLWAFQCNADFLLFSPFVCLCVFFFVLLVFWEPEQLSLTDEIVILVLDNQSSFLGKSFMDGFYRRETGRVLKNMKMKILMSSRLTFCFCSCLRQSFVFGYEQTLVFLWKKPWSLVGPTKNSVVFAVFWFFPVVGRQNFQHW